MGVIAQKCILDTNILIYHLNGVLDDDTDVLSEILDFILFLKLRHGKQAAPEKTRANMRAIHDISMMLPQYELGEVKGSLQREEIYTDAR